MTKKKVLGEHDVLNYILYSIRGGADDNAGRMYITILMKLDDIGELPHGSLLCKLWMDVPLPEGMSIDVKIGVRYLQNCTYQRSECNSTIILDKGFKRQCL